MSGDINLKVCFVERKIVYFHENQLVYPVQEWVMAKKMFTTCVSLLAKR